jgi:hypothetical protein|tara:strand:- start:498 stop:644 length:147 start_codon:yes stop_codon:yes gene_type:complete
LWWYTNKEERKWLRNNKESTGSANQPVPAQYLGVEEEEGMMKLKEQSL